MVPSLCSYCDGTGDVILNKVDDILFDDEGELIIKYKDKENEPYAKRSQNILVRRI